MADSYPTNRVKVNAGTLAMAGEMVKVGRAAQQMISSILGPILGTGLAGTPFAGREVSVCFNDSLSPTHAGGLVVALEAGWGLQRVNGNILTDPYALQWKHWRLAAATSVTVSPGDALLDRIDIIVARAVEVETDSQSVNYMDVNGNKGTTSVNLRYETSVEVSVVEGTPDAAPAPPATPDGWFLVADVRVNAGTSVVASMDDKRHLMSIRAPWGGFNTQFLTFAFNHALDEYEMTTGIAPTKVVAVSHLAAQAMLRLGIGEGTDARVVMKVATDGDGHPELRFLFHDLADPHSFDVANCLAEISRYEDGGGDNRSELRVLSPTGRGTNVPVDAGGAALVLGGDDDWAIIARADGPAGANLGRVLEIVKRSNWTNIRLRIYPDSRIEYPQKPVSFRSVPLTAGQSLASNTLAWQWQTGGWQLDTGAGLVTDERFEIDLEEHFDLIAGLTWGVAPSGVRVFVQVGGAAGSVTAELYQYTLLGALKVDCGTRTWSPGDAAWKTVALGAYMPDKNTRLVLRVSAVGAGVTMAGVWLRGISAYYVRSMVS